MKLHLHDAKLEAEGFCYVSRVAPVQSSHAVDGPHVFFSEDDEGVSSDEDMPFKDDLNDQSYDPKSGRCVRLFVCVMISSPIL